MQLQMMRSTFTSDELLSKLKPRSQRTRETYCIVAQSAEELQSPWSSPAISVWPYLVDSAQTELLTSISVYSGSSDTRERIRLLYMNTAALIIWREMGMRPTVIGEQMRPPHNAELAFGVPFSE